MKQFLPFDDRWMDDPDAMPGPLVPYQVGLPCRHAMAGNDQRTAPKSPESENRSPCTMPSRATVPAASSRT
jgi:hypothetical protein